MWTVSKSATRPTTLSNAGWAATDSIDRSEPSELRAVRAHSTAPAHDEPAPDSIEGTIQVLQDFDAAPKVALTHAQRFQRLLHAIGSVNDPLSLLFQLAKALPRIHEAGLNIGIGTRQAIQDFGKSGPAGRGLIHFGPFARVLLLQAFDLCETGGCGRTRRRRHRRPVGIADRDWPPQRGRAARHVRSRRSTSLLRHRPFAGPQSGSPRRPVLLRRPESTPLQLLLSLAELRSQAADSEQLGFHGARRPRSCLSVVSNPAICCRASASRPSWCRSPSSARATSRSSSRTALFQFPGPPVRPGHLGLQLRQHALFDLQCRPRVRGTRAPQARRAARAAGPSTPCTSGPSRPACAACGVARRARRAGPSTASGWLRRGELAERLGLLRLEPADAGGLVEDLAAVLRGGLQQLIDAALGDDGVAAGAGPAAEEDLLDVLEPATSGR